MLVRMWSSRNSYSLLVGMQNDTVTLEANHILTMPACLPARSRQSCLTLCNPMDSSPQGPLSMEFSRQKYWSELPFPTPGDLPNPGIEPMSLALAGRFFTTAPPGKPNIHLNSCQLTTTSSISTTCCREKTYTTRRDRKIFPRVFQNSKHAVLHHRNK